ncbi:hypothetical protein ISF_04376 [Cordyceps fumosorosea ARSEF 2679]|uniref:Mediator of RNA polymerase II transcription subunit 4 n=1 Tax=Cordyceps fumosorosea (strain ARSEF 2679) TaxID=1081104 RepID=A0A167XGU3_CORFA|nr:hypothetical protein ISF_04376 [Cordyceps fumosorosea ARSEF 2679]OAA64966.1 hypothetical protein ISF_04376 [Cordyceps fumosorosea ARSEF 2679]
MAFCLQNRFNKDKAVPVKQPNSLMANQVQANDAVPTQKPASSTTNPEMTGNATPMEETPPSSSSTNDKVVSMSKMYSSMQAVFLLADEMTGELLTILNTIASSHGATVDKDSLAGPLLRLHELIEYASYEAKDGLTKALRVDFRDVESHLQAVTARREQLLAGRDKLIEKWQEAALVMHLPADPDFFTHVCRLGEDLEDTRRRIANAGKHDAVEEAVEVEAEGRPQRSSGSETSSPMVPTPVQSDGTNSQENTPDSSQDSHSKVASKTSETICEKGGEKGELWKWPAIIPSKCTSL